MANKSFDNTKNKIENTWEQTDRNLSDESNLKRQNIISSQKNLNPAITVIPLISHQEMIHVFGDESIGLLMLENIQEFTISNMNDSLISTAKITRKFYRDQQTGGDIGEEEYIRIENYTFFDISWKYIDDSTVLLQIHFPFINFSNETFMDVNLTIRNPNIYTAIPKFTI